MNETKTKLCWWGIAVCCGFLALANLIIPFRTVRSQSRTNARIADLQAAGTRPVAAKELHDALVDVNVITNATYRFMTINFYIPFLIAVIAIVFAQTASEKKE